MFSGGRAAHGFSGKYLLCQSIHSWSAGDIGRGSPLPGLGLRESSTGGRSADGVSLTPFFSVLSIGFSFRIGNVCLGSSTLGRTHQQERNFLAGENAGSCTRAPLPRRTLSARLSSLRWRVLLRSGFPSGRSSYPLCRKAKRMLVRSTLPYKADSFPSSRGKIHRVRRSTPLLSLWFSSTLPSLSHFLVDVTLSPRAHSSLFQGSSGSWRR
jgi:hypothetical protein